MANDPYAKYGGVAQSTPPSSSPNDPYSKYGGSALAAQSDPNNNGIVGPDQTNPPPPSDRIADSLSNATISPPESGFGASVNRLKNRVRDFLGADSKPAGDVLAGPVLGPLAIAHGTSQLSTHPSRGIHEIVSGVGQTTALPAAIAFPGTMAYSAPSILAQSGVTAGAKKLGVSDDTSNLLGDVAGVGAGFGLAKTFKGPGPLSTPTKETAFNVLHPKNAIADDSILPTVRQAAANQGVKVGLGNTPKGKAGVELPQEVIQGAIDDHESQVQSVKQPYQNYPQDNSAVAKAALSKITPEMMSAAQNGDSSVARQIAQIHDIANRAVGADTVGKTDQLRHSWNDELNSELGKSDASQDVSAASTQAKRVAANALRQGFYDNLSNLSGTDVRGLAQTEGALIEAKAGVTKSGDSALMSRSNDLGENPRLTALGKAGMRVSIERPGSLLRFLPEAVQAIIDPTAKTPVGQYNARVKRVLSNLPDPTAPTPPYQPPATAGLLGQGSPQLPSPSIQGTPSTPPPFNNSFPLQRGVGATPPNAAGTVEHLPYEIQSDSTTLPNSQGNRLPKQLGMGKSAIDEATRRGGGQPPSSVPKDEATAKSVGEFVKQAQSKSAPPPLPPEVEAASSTKKSGSKLTADGFDNPEYLPEVKGNGLAQTSSASNVRGDKSAMDQAKAELPNGTMSQHLQRAAEIAKASRDNALPQPLSEAISPPSPLRGEGGKGKLPAVMPKTKQLLDKATSFLNGRDTVGLTDLKNKFNIDTTTAILLLDDLEQSGKVAPASGKGPRTVVKK